MKFALLDGEKIDGYNDVNFDEISKVFMMWDAGVFGTILFHRVNQRGAILFPSSFQHLVFVVMTVFDRIK